MFLCELDGHENHSTHHAQSFNSYLGAYVAFCVGMVVVYGIVQVVLFKGALRASNLLHQRLISTILSTTLRSVSCRRVALCFFH